LTHTRGYPRSCQTRADSRMVPIDRSDPSTDPEPLAT
jgi:hypothetical protein